jgi:hypothetical protein
LLRTTATACLLFITLAAPGLRAAEIIGGYALEAPVIAERIASGDGPATEKWLTTTSLPVTWREAYSGIGIIDDGMTDVRANCIVEVDFADGVLVNKPGPDLLMVEARFVAGSYAVSTEYAGFDTQVAVPSEAFSYADRNLFYYRGSPFLGPFPGAIYVAPIDLSDLGVPLGVSIDAVRFRTTSSGASPLGLGAIVPIPEPSAGLALLGVFLIRRPRPSTR